MCEYCKKIINNKRILDIDNEEETHMEIINQKKSWGYMLYVEIEGQDNDGYKPSQFFQINYCPMCGRKLVRSNKMTDEEIEKIAKKVLELQKAEGVKTTQSLLTFQEVQQRYHKEIYQKFGTTSGIDSAIRTVATYSQGQRYVARLGGKEFDNAVQVADKLYKLVLGEKE